MFALNCDSEEHSIPNKLKYWKNITQNTEVEFYLRIGKRGIIINWGSSKRISPKTNTTLPPVLLVTKSNTNLCRVGATTVEILKKKMFLKTLQSSQDNISVGVSFLRGEACNFLKKETPTQVLSCEFCKIFKNTFLQNSSGQLLVVLQTKFDLLSRSCSFLDLEFKCFVLPL